MYRTSWLAGETSSELQLTNKQNCLIKYGFHYWFDYRCPFTLNWLIKFQITVCSGLFKNLTLSGLILTGCGAETEQLCLLKNIFHLKYIPSCLLCSLAEQPVATVFLMTPNWLTALSFLLIRLSPHTAFPTVPSPCCRLPLAHPLQASSLSFSGSSRLVIHYAWDKGGLWAQPLGWVLSLSAGVPDKYMLNRFWKQTNKMDASKPSGERLFSFRVEFNLWCIQTNMNMNSFGLLFKKMFF